MIFKSGRGYLTVSPWKKVATGNSPDRVQHFVSVLSRELSDGTAYEGTQRIRMSLGHHGCTYLCIQMMRAAVLNRFGSGQIWFHV